MAHSSNSLKRSHSAFNSPEKPPFPASQASNSQPIFSQSSTSQLGSSSATPQFRTPSFTTPRKPQDIDFSSGPENASSPEQADNEDTPEPKPMLNFSANDGKSKRNSLWGMYNKYAPPKLTSYGDGRAGAGRVHKRRKAQRFDKQAMLREMRRQSADSSDDESKEEIREERKVEEPSSPKEVGFVPFLFGIGHRVGDLISKHPDAYSPRRITEYAWALCNCAVVLGVLYIMLNVLTAVQKDMNRGNDLAVAQLTTQMATCRNNWEINGCGGPRPPPALEQDCAKWEVCMNQDPQAIQGARIGAATWAAILNGFVDELKWKTMVSRLISCYLEKTTGRLKANCLLFLQAFAVIFIAIMNLTFGGIYKLVPSASSPPSQPRHFSHNAYPPPYDLIAPPHNPPYGYQNLGWRQDQNGRPWDANRHAIEYNRDYESQARRSPSKEYKDRERSRSPVKKRLTWE
ncbi:MAG: hypothetical protein Q9227_007882 [Pyrenula ochraceoflavens]